MRYPTRNARSLGILAAALMAMLVLAVVVRNGLNRQPAPSEAVNPRAAAAMATAGLSARTASARVPEGLRPKSVSDGPMIAKTASLSIVAKEFAPARRSIEAILVRCQGYAAELTIGTGPDNRPTLEGSLRVPATELANALAELKALGTVESESQKGEEVTGQYSDLLARLRNSRAIERRLETLLEQRTGNMSDVLEVEREIARVRGEIEESEADQAAIEHRVDYASIDLRLSEAPHVPPAIPSIGARLRSAAVAGFRNAARSLARILLLALNVGPVLLLWAVLLFFPARYALRRMRIARRAA